MAGQAAHLGFTLAEVLITLGIIGVVAAITMPVLMAKYKQQVFATAFKKQYSVLNNTISFLELNDGLKDCYQDTFICPTEKDPNNRCYTSKNADCQALKTQLVSSLKLTPVNKEKFTYAKRNEVLANGGAAVLTAYNYDSYFSLMDAYMLPDGAVVLFTDNYSGYLEVVFIIDVNGEKGPNKWGYDAFWLVLSQRNGKLRLTDEWASLSEKGGSLPRNILMNNWGNDMKIDGIHWN